MGLKGFGNFIAQLAKSQGVSLFKRVSLETYSGKVIAIDVSGLIYKGMYAESGTETRHILAENDIPKLRFFTYFMNLFTQFKKYDVFPIFIFDTPKGETKECYKFETIKKRKERKEKARNEFEKLKGEVDGIEDVEEKMEKMKKMKSLKVQTNSVHTYHITFLKEIIRYLGFAYIFASGEAEALCSRFCGGCKLVVNGKKEIINSDALISDDYDVFCSPHSSIILRNFKDGKVDEWDVEKIIKILGFETRQQMMDFGILIGTDMNDTIFPPKISMQFIQIFKKIKKPKSISFENIDTSHIKLAIRMAKYEEVYERINEIRNVFKKAKIGISAYLKPYFKRSIFHEKDRLLKEFGEAKNENDKFHLYREFIQENLI
jgi:5'-3' exonuclease